MYWIYFIKFLYTKYNNIEKLNLLKIRGQLDEDGFAFVNKFLKENIGFTGEIKSDDFTQVAVNVDKKYLKYKIKYLKLKQSQF